MARNVVVGGSGAAAQGPAGVAAAAPDNIMVSRTADVGLPEATISVRHRSFDSAIDARTLTIDGGLTTCYVETFWASDS
jgi:hypothetical protein